jgi:hypothetical protein
MGLVESGIAVRYLEFYFPYRPCEDALKIDGRLHSAQKISHVTLSHLMPIYLRYGGSVYNAGSDDGSA